MCAHEQKYCPRCGGKFECRVGSVHICQCAAVPMTQEEREHIALHYADCLCAGCMMAMKTEYHQGIFRDKVKKISGIL